ncbi:AI-2E family transporter [Bifidobacterium choloepi]|uniref:AI-2E family transporter n=1 Tax=Bifidobacterium choloepi TaxID=2614131 RepID=A0A6I5N6X4_9BIFI|nr:AI-2E family transporter [Bifidobacterium choloepi]NEG69551.1 AI-2E family transporter [Bifidobacterium choloepi]
MTDQRKPIVEEEANTPDEQKFDLDSLFPAKGDARRPPEWYSRALIYAAIAVFVAWFCYTSWFKISYIVLDVVVAMFLALAVEPIIIRLIKHGWRRGAAAVVSLAGLLVIIVVLFYLFGNLFVQQMISMVKGLPGLYAQLADSVEQYAHFKLPEINDLGNELLKSLQSIQTSSLSDFAGQAVSTLVGLLGGLLEVMTALMVAFYIAIAGPRLRRSLCQWLAPKAQRKFLLIWTVVQEQISSFLFSRSILAACSATCMSIFLIIIKVPYWLPLALFCGIVSQFVPTVGTYIGGALPVLFAWGDRGIWYAVGVVVFITCYQQIENLLLSPKISEKTMDLNPCVAFLSVLVFGSIFGALGAFLALPITAAIQVIIKIYTRRYELVDVPLMNDPTPRRKSKMMAVGDAIASHAPRAAKGSSGHVTFDDEIRALQQAAYQLPPDSAQETERQREDSPTVAIPKHMLDHVDKKDGLTMLKGVGGDDSSGTAPAEDNAVSPDGGHAAANGTSTGESSPTSADAAPSAGRVDLNGSDNQPDHRDDDGATTPPNAANPRRNWR